MKKLAFTLLALVIGVATYAQTTLRGTVIDEESNEALIGASVLLAGTSTGTITDIDGNFELTTDQSTGTLDISYTGYETINLTFDGSASFGTVAMGVNAYGLGEVVVTGVMDIVQDRRTPVAVSTITTAEIQAKGGNVEFPELMKSTPSIYVAGQAGGYGDSEVFTRGFDQTNTAFLLNGQPINGMEDGRMYWSNWSGMTDVASAVQVQRGLGSSKLAISSVGGTTNIIMKSTEQKQGGSVSYLLGNDQYNKITASYNTGLINNKFGMTVLLTHWQGNGWAEGTKGQGQNYFISAGFQPDDKRHSFNFLLTGAPQWHDQNFNKRISDHFQSGEFNIKFNSNFGDRNGEYQTLRRNFYHKPVANLNWEFKVNEKSSLSTVLYASWGRGGGTGDRGSRNNRFFTDDGYLDFTQIEAANRADAGSEEWIIRASVNNHNWVGAVSKFETDLSEELNFSVGADLRRYHGSHFRQVADLLGAPSYTARERARPFPQREITATFSADPWAALFNSAEGGEQLNYSNDETIAYAGVFSQLELVKDKFSGYVQGALSNQSHVRFELFNVPERDEESEKVTNLGYNLKGGFSIETGANSNFFFNTGFYQRQPFHDNIYLNFSNTVNPVTVPEKIFGLEAGYKYASNNFAANVNVYRTSWKDRATTDGLREGEELPNGTVVPATGDWYVNTLQNQLHSGVELDFSYDVSRKFRVKGFASIGKWEYDGTLKSDFFNDDRELVFSEPGADVDGLKVGGSAQTSFGIGTDIKLTDAFKLDIDFNQYSDLYARPRSISSKDDFLKLPSFGLLDIGASYNVNLANGQLLTFRANLYNALGTEYISRATSVVQASTSEAENWNGVNRSNFVQFGKTRTWNVSVRYSF